jgi:AraC family transcriptional regulator
VKIELLERPEVRVACVHHTMQDGDSRARWWRGQVAPWLAHQGLLDCPRYGVTRDGRCLISAEPCRYDACVALPVGLRVSDAAETTIPGGHYAVTYFKGRPEELTDAWRAFIAEVVRHGIRWDEARFPHEHHPRGAFYDPKSGVFHCELCLPVKPE